MKNVVVILFLVIIVILLGVVNRNLKLLQQFSHPLAPAGLTGKTIHFESEVPGYSVEKNENFSHFTGYLESLHFWDPQAVFNGDSRKWETAKTLTIVLTNIQQSGDNVGVMIGW